MRGLAWVLGWLGATPPGTAARLEAARELVARVQQLQDSYPEAMEEDPLEGREAVAEHVKEAQQLALAWPALAVHATTLERVYRAIKQAAPPRLIDELCAPMLASLVETERVPVQPPERPSPRRGERLYRELCARCHATDGSAAVPLAETMHPPPSSFLAPDTMNPMSAFRAFNVITYGVPETAMPGFAAVPERDRWAVAFYLLSLRQRRCEGVAPRVPLLELSTRTDLELISRYGEKGLRCLRRGKEPR